MRPATIERRFNPIEIRADEGGKTFIGRACEYNAVSEPIYGMFTEELAPGCFDESLKSGRDVYCSVDHDANRILGRVSAGTLTLKPDERGIGVECPVAGYSYAQDLLLAIQRRDIRGMSFIFDVTDDQWSKRDGKSHRTVKKADLYEVSFVVFPAYPQTDAGLRTAFPVAGEQRAIERAKALMESAEDWQEEAARRSRLLRLLQAF